MYSVGEYIRKRQREKEKKEKSLRLQPVSPTTTEDSSLCVSLKFCQLELQRTEWKKKFTSAHDLQQGHVI